MAIRWLTLRLPVFLALSLILAIIVACGGTAPAEPVVVEKEVIKEVPKEIVVEKEVIKEVPKEVVVEKEVVKEVVVEKEIIKEVLVNPQAAAEDASGVIDNLEGFPKAGEGGVPAEASKLTIAVDSWGVSDINPWTISSVQFLQDLFNGTLMRQSPNGTLAPYWVTSYNLTEDGITYHLNPDAKFQDGSPADAQALKDNLDAIAGYSDIAQYGYDKPPYHRGRIKSCCESFEVISPTELYVKTKGPKPLINAEIGGHGYHGIWYGNPDRIREGLDAYLKDPSGYGPFKLVQWDAGNRAVLERWDGYWADYPWYHKPQYKDLEVLTTADHAARYALLASRQVDMVYNIPWPIAKDLVRSEAFTRGVNPGKGDDIWTQTYQANGMLGMTFALPHRMKNTVEKWPEGSVDEGGVVIKPYTFPDGFENDPTLDVRVRRALNLAIDKVAISEGPHFGFSHPSGSIYSAGTFGSRDEVVHNPTPYDPDEAKRLLAEAGYADGFEIQGHFGQFAGRPGIPEAADAIASYWKDIGVTVSWQEHDPSDFVKGFRAGRLSWVQVSLPTFGRQEHASRRVVSSYHSTGTYQHPHTDETTALTHEVLRTIPEDEQKRMLAEIEDRVLALEEIFPLYGMSLVMGYTDRVISHPTVENSPHFKHLELILLKD